MNERLEMIRQLLNELKLRGTRRRQLQEGQISPLWNCRSSYGRSLTIYSLFWNLTTPHSIGFYSGTQS